MKISKFAVNRPVFVVMAVLIVLIVGGVSLSRLSIDLMPDITYPTLSITTTYENASPEEIEELVTRPVEEAMSAVPGVEEVTTVSGEGISRARVSFSWGTDLDSAVNDIRDRLDRVIPMLPDDVERPAIRKYDLASFPILILGAASNLDPIQMRQIIDDQVKYRIERIPGVAALDIRGGLHREITVGLDPHRTKALGIPLDQILSRIKSENVNIPAGTLEQGKLEVMIRVPGIYTSLDELRHTVVAIRDGVPVQIKDIATIEDSYEKVHRIVRINGKPGFRLAVNKQSGTNTVEVARKVLREIERVNRDIPQIHITPIIDTSDYIKRSITNVGSVMLYGSILAVSLLLIFLRSIRTTAVIATAIPISIIATFMLMYFGGFTLNIMTLGGLALGIGMLVDSAIVVLENIFRHRECGVESKSASIAGSEEVTAAIIASTLTTLSVFLPLVFVRGMSGVMFKQLAFVVSFSLGCSLVVALSLIPMLSARILGPVDQTGYSKRGNPSRSARFFKGLEDSYGQLLGFALSHRLLVIFSTALALAGSLWLIPLIGVELMPETDQNEVRIYGEMGVGTRVEVVDEVFKKIETIVKQEVPETKSTVAYLGGTSWRTSGSHTGQLRIALKPKNERTRSSEQIAAVLRRKLRGIPGMKIRTRPGRGLFLLRIGTHGSERVQVEIRGYNLKTAEALARRVQSMVDPVNGVTDSKISIDSGRPEQIILIDRQKAADMKLSVSQISDMLKTIISGTRASNFRETGDEIPIMVKLKDAEQMNLRDILDLTINNRDGNPVVLRNLVRVEQQTGPVTIERKNQERYVVVTANISGRDMGSILSDIREGLRSIPIPKDFSIVFGGDYGEQQKAFRELLLSFILALILVYMVMASLYESLRDPFVVMFSVPLAAIGVIAMLFLSGTTFNIQSFIGCIILGGIVVNNAILLVDHINLLRRRDKMPLHQAIEEGGRRRLRPILMTALTTMLALVPLATGMGEGGEAQAPMARAVIGGLLSSTLITLIVIPTIYSVFALKSEKARKTDAKVPAAEEVAT